MAARQVTLVLCTDERVIGALAPFQVDFPYWQDTGHVISGCRELYGLTPIVLRILDAQGQANGDGGPTTYLAQLPPGQPDWPGLRPWRGPDPMLTHPLRARYAEPGGPQADLAWASEALAHRGARVLTARQERTWNLSCIWRLVTDRGDYWLKGAPPFYATEGALLTWFAAQSPRIAGHVPGVVACEPGRLLMAGIPGEDRYDGSPDIVDEAVDRLVELQVHAAAHVADLLALGVPDQRGAALQPRLRDVVARRVQPHEWSPDSRARLTRLVDSAPARFAQAGQAGLPDTLTHGDFHPGNTRGSVGALRILDWADASIGHPAFDIMRLLGVTPAERQDAVRQRWASGWRSAYPGSDPLSALEALTPVAGLVGAAGYQRFLDHIEPDERRYHEADPAACLRAALTALTALAAGEPG